MRRDCPPRRGACSHCSVTYMRQLKYVANDFWRNLESKKQIKDQKLKPTNRTAAEIIKLSSVAIIEHKEHVKDDRYMPITSSDTNR